MESLEPRRDKEQFVSLQCAAETSVREDVWAPAAGWAGLSPLYQFTSSEDEAVEEMAYGQNTDLYQHDDQSSYPQNPQKERRSSPQHSGEKLQLLQ